MFRHRAVHSREGNLLCAPEQLTIRSARDGQAHVVELIGELDMNTAEAFEHELQRVEATDASQIIVDLSGLQSIDSEGLKVFIHANARSRRADNRLRLVRGPDQVHKTFETTGLVSRLPFTACGNVSSLAHPHRSRARVVVSRPVQDWASSAG